MGIHSFWRRWNFQEWRLSESKLGHWRPAMKGIVGAQFPGMTLLPSTLRSRLFQCTLLIVLSGTLNTGSRQLGHLELYWSYKNMSPPTLSSLQGKGGPINFIVFTNTNDVHVVFYPRCWLMVRWVSNVVFTISILSFGDRRMKFHHLKYRGWKLEDTVSSKIC